jgi:hypothetical protein
MKSSSPDRNSIGLDRLATYDEVCYALALSAEVFSQQAASDGYDDEDGGPELAGRFGAGSNEPERLPLLKEKLDPSK